MKIIDENIFRAYDIRGVYNDDLTDDFAYLLGRAFGSKLRLDNKSETIVGYDNRLSSVPLYNTLVKGITDSGIDVINIGLVTTPMYYFAWKLFNGTSGIMITASHNPKEYNGFKISFNGIYNAYGEYIQEFKEYIKKGIFLEGNGKITTVKIKDQYMAFVLERIKLGNRKLKIVVDAGNGTASIVIKDILDQLDIDYIPLYCESNPLFPNHHPDPSVAKNIKVLSETVVREKADVGFGYDGDADRIGLVDEQGKMISIDHFMIIIIRHILKGLPDKRILFDVKCSKSLEDEIIKLGGTPVLSRTGNSYLRARIVSDNILFGGELSGHVFFNDKFPGYDDGIYASLRMIEILSETDQKISDLLKGINHYYATDEIKMEVADNIKFALIEKIKDYAQSKNYNFLTLDGCKVIFDDGFALVRASNTGPNITLRFEALTEKRLTDIEDEFMNIINEIKNQI